MDFVVVAKRTATILLASGLFSAASAQTTYTWNVAGSGAWTTASNWTPTRTSPMGSDLLRIDGSITAMPTLTNVPTQTIRQLSLINGANATLHAAAMSTLSVQDGSGPDFIIPSGTTLNLTGGGPLTIDLMSSATGSIAGAVNVLGGAHRILCASANGLRITSGGVVTASSGFFGTLFGSTSLNSVLFEPGSTYVSAAGGSPFGATAPNTVVTFEPASLYRHQQSAVPDFPGRTYGHFQFDVGAAITSGVTGSVTMRSLTVTAGTLHIRIPSIAIGGDISVAGGATLDFDPTSPQAIALNGSSPQGISNGGTLTLNANANLSVSNPLGVTIQSPLALSGTVSIASGALLAISSPVTMAESVTVEGTLQMNGGTLGLTGSPSLVVNGTLALGSGVITTTAMNQVEIASGGTISGESAASYVNGRLRRFIATSGSPSSRTFAIGDGSTYTPVVAAFSSVSVAGNVTLSTTAGDHPSIATSGLVASATVNRFWSIAGDVTWLSPWATFNFAPGEVDNGANVSNFAARSFAGNSWSHEDAGAPTTTSIEVALSRFGDFQVGESSWLFTDVSTSSGTADAGQSDATAWGDYDQDGDLDLYVANDAEPSKLYQNTNGTFTDVAGTAGVALADAHSAGWMDYDLDGDLDLYGGGLFQNDGNGVFADRTTPSNLPYGAGGAEWADVGLDGGPDVYLDDYYVHRNPRPASSSEVFTAVTPLGGPDATWGDYDGDGDLDLCFSLYDVRIAINTGGALVTELLVTAMPVSSPASISWADFNNDGRLDIFVTSASGVCYLLRNDGGGSFVDVASASGVLGGGNCTSAAWADVDNDRDLDLYITRTGSANLFYRNNFAVNGTFSEEGAALGLSTVGSSRAAAWGDYDGDGDLDLYVAKYGESNQLYRNGLNSGNHWLRVQLQHPANRTVVGARVRVVHGSTSQIRDILAGNSRGSHNAPTADFGLGATASIDSLIIHWRSGNVQVVTPVPAVDQVVVVTEAVTFLDVTNSAGVSAGNGNVGISVGDYDGDGDADVFNAHAKTLFRNNGDGTFADVTASAGIVIPSTVAWSGAWGDFDSDGYLDLFACPNVIAPMLFRNLGNGSFADVSSNLDFAVSTGSGSCVDYDVDGDLDLYISGDTYGVNAGMLENNGDGTFTNVFSSTGFALAGVGSWCDYDEDGDPDVYVSGYDVNDVPRSTLYRNEGSGVFADVGPAAGVERLDAIWDPAWADYNGDGRVDLIVGDGSVFRNLGNGLFADATAETHFGDFENLDHQNTPRFADVDNDGDLDVALRVLSGGSDLLRNDGGTFGSAGKPFWPNLAFRSPVALDYDGDGDMDVASSTQGGRLHLYRNELAGSNHWLQVALHPSNNRSPIGAKVRVVHGSTRQVKQVGLGDPPFSQDDVVAHFGLGAATAIDSLIVRWPDGQRQIVSPVPAVDQLVTVNQAFVANTPVGSNVELELGPATVTFDSVALAGETQLDQMDSGPAPPWNIRIVPAAPPVYYDLTTTALFDGPVEICIGYDASDVLGSEGALELLHYDTSAGPPVWVNVTTSIDTVGNVICGSTLSLSPFIVAELDPTDASVQLPSSYRLFANVPNPFNPMTTIRYDLPQEDRVRLEVLDIGGRLIRTLVSGRVEAGRHEIVWRGLDEDGHRVASGVYFYRLQAGSFTTSRRMVLLK